MRLLLWHATAVNSFDTQAEKVWFVPVEVFYIGKELLLLLECEFGWCNAACEIIDIIGIPRGF